MAKFVTELPTEIMKDFEKIYGSTDKIFGGMTRAGAKVVKKNIEAGARRVFNGSTASKMVSKLKITQVYKTPSDGGINTKVAFYGYIPRKDGRAVKIKGGYYNGVPAPLLASLREFGASSGGAMPEGFKRYWTKKPFIRPAFSNKKNIETAMLQAQKELSGGLLDD